MTLSEYRIIVENSPLHLPRICLDIPRFLVTALKFFPFANFFPDTFLARDFRFIPRAIRNMIIHPVKDLRKRGHLRWIRYGVIPDTPAIIV